MPQMSALGWAGERKAVKLILPSPVAPVCSWLTYGLVMSGMMVRVMMFTGPAWMG
jgi:hypothetical protein